MYILQYRRKGGIWEDSVTDAIPDKLIEIKRESEENFVGCEYRVIRRTTADEVVE